MPSVENPSLPVPAAWILRPLAGADHPALLRLNAANWPAVYPLGADLLAGLCGFGGHHLVAVDAAGAVLGYVLTFSSASAYDDTEIRELRGRLTEPFLYICQVVVAPEHRGRGMARAFYDAAAVAARREGLRFLACDVNTDPPNPGSAAFHRQLGFTEIGRGTASNGFAVAFLARRL